MRVALEIERLGRVAAEQAAPVLTAKLEAVERCSNEADARTGETDC
jgi:hypothetical protein